MEDEDFVADSDEDKQEMVEAQALEEERLTRRRLEEAAAVNLQQVMDSQSPKKQDEGGNVAIVSPDLVQIAQEEDGDESEEDESSEEEEEAHDEQEKKEEQVEEDGVLAVGTLVEVAPRTWPGINKQGGQGRVSRVHVEKNEDGEEEIFYDVRYTIQGGFDRHVEREFVQSSAVMQQQSDRKQVDREYYHDDFINKPHEKKQRELEKKHEQKRNHLEQAQERAPHRKKRKRPQPTHSDQVRKTQLDTSHSEVEGKERSRKMSKVDEDMFVLTERKINSPQTAPSPAVKQAKATQRRQNRILVSSDEDSSDGSDGDNNQMQSPSHRDYKQTDAQSNASRTAGGSAQARRKTSVEQHPKRQRKKQKSSLRRFVGGYEHNLVDDDGKFIQPEGNPTELPEDVIREIKLKLRSTKDGLMAQLQEIYAQQLEKMANFHEEQKVVNQQLKDIGQMPSADLHALRRKMRDLRTYVTKKLVHAGEDAMNAVIQEIHKKRGRPPTLLDSLELEIGERLDQLKECQPWVRTVQNAVNNELSRRREEIPQEEITASVYSSDSGASSAYIDDVEAPVLPTDEEDKAFDADFSYDYEPTISETRRYGHGLSEHRLETKERGHSVPTGTKRYRRKKKAKSTTLDDFFFNQGSSNQFTSNFRLVGKHKKTFAMSDPRFNWVTLARKQQRRIGNGTKMRSTGQGTTHTGGKTSSIKAASRDGEPSIQDQRFRMRDRRYRSQSKQFQTRDTVYAQPAPFLTRNSANVFANGISFDDLSSEKQFKPAEPTAPTIHPNNSKQQSTDWEAIFEIVSDSSSPTDWSILTAISREGQASLLAFGYPLQGTLAPSHLFTNGDWEFEDGDNFGAVVIRRVARLRQLLNDLRIQESRFMTFLSEGGLDIVDGDDYTSTAEWSVLVSLEDAYHKAIASLAASLLAALEGVSPSALPGCLKVVLAEFGALIRQLPDCNSLLVGCEAYFFFFEVASRDSVTTPLLTAISRTYWYCINLLSVLQPMVKSHATTKKDGQDSKTELVDKVILAVVLFLFDWYMYLPTSHRLENKEGEGVPRSLQPALSLWMLVRSCSTISARVDKPNQDLLSAKEMQVWASVQAVHQQGCFDELARCFIRRESCGGYMSEKTTGSSNTENRDEAFESQLLALDATWDLLTVLTRIYAESDDSKHEEAVCEAKWGLVKGLLQLHADKRGFLPFDLPPTDYADTMELILRRLWASDAPRYPGDIAELPQFLKEYLSRCRKIGNGRAQLAAFAGECDDDGDIAASICKIVWIHLLKLEKRVHRSRFYNNVLSTILDTPDKHHGPALSALTNPQPPQKESDWNWGKTQHTTVVTNPVKQVGETQQRSNSACGVGKERMKTALLLTFAIVGVCLECGDEEQLSIERRVKDVKNMARDVDFYCKEIIRWTSGKPEYEVLASQSLYMLGAFLLEKNSAEFPPVFWGLSEKLEASMRNLQANGIASTLPKKQAVGTNTDKEKRHMRFQSAAISSLYQMRDLTKKMMEMPSSGIRVGNAYGYAVDKSLEHIFGAGMVACLNGGIQKFITANDLKIAVEIFQLILPRSPDEPHKCLTSVPAPTNSYGDNDALFAQLDVDDISGGTTAPMWTADKCRPRAIELVVSKMRLVLQQLVLYYPTNDVRRFDELYAIDLLGMILSTCEVQFFWNNVTSTSVKHRNLAPRVLGAALKYNPEKEWLGQIFMKAKGADQELPKAWLLGTLDVSAFDTSPIPFTLEENLFKVENMSAVDLTGSTQGCCIRDSDYWAMLTDGIIYQLLRDNPLAFAAMDPNVLKVLVEVAENCKFCAAIRTNHAGLHDAATLYDLHLDVFRSFCKSGGSTWKPRSNMNQFRAKLMDSQSGIFVAFLEAYKINFRRACDEIDEMNHDWHVFADLFLRKAGVNATNGRSYHEMDDTNQSFGKQLTGLTTMFRFMYQCMDIFMFYCGEMAIGDTNPFFNAMELMFRQANDAEFTQASKRLEDQRRSSKRTGVRNVNDELRKGYCQTSKGFVDSVQLFFARQKYPSLIYWFAQTSEIYQTFSDEGWHLSPLRTLLVNILDPDGPLGINSYYPDDKASRDSNLDVDVKAVRREAFYLSCGFFNCRCTRSFEHSRAKPTLISSSRLQQLRKFVLDDFMRETFTFVLREDSTSLLETMIPMSQFVRAVLNHANLNVRLPSATQVEENCGDSTADKLAHHDFQLCELYPCLEWMVECIIKVAPCEEAVHSSLCCVLLTELCGIMCEAIAYNDHRPMLELIDLVELLISYLRPVLVALSKQSTTAQGTIFTPSEFPPSEKLHVHRFSRSGFRDIEVTTKFAKAPGTMDPYGISIIRASMDLFAAIRRLASQCKTSSDGQLQGLTMISA
ncbi:hypothetical protein P3T76_007146 [Phytophthora citrophthora]|uniref:Uncharacterized protein n=1 Tax=Phytophthora citrophthora TaxID=4793 RepID=A0AAD9GMR2_9STRA|nr:hypothetical protein P3T76_007146 [Phytophthora citrophthora]